jgi:hypothetical protein
MVLPVGQSTRDARLWNGAYLDIFIYNEQDIVDIDASFLRLRGGVVLRELQDFGHQLLDKSNNCMHQVQHHFLSKKLNYGASGTRRSSNALHKAISKQIIVMFGDYMFYLKIILHYVKSGILAQKQVGSGCKFITLKLMMLLPLHSNEKRQ